MSAVEYAVVLAASIGASVAAGFMWGHAFAERQRRKAAEREDRYQREQALRDRVWDLEKKIAHFTAKEAGR
jgi:predicted acylesterase/phospholipase RssA